MASSVTGVKRWTRLPSGSRKRMERLPQGIVVGVAHCGDAGDLLIELDHTLQVR
jgi:hypothetical protein